jgi:hypothetical protein
MRRFNGLHTEPFSCSRHDLVWAAVIVPCVGVRQRHLRLDQKPSLHLRQWPAFGASSPRIAQRMVAVVHGAMFDAVN